MGEALFFDVCVFTAEAELERRAEDETVGDDVAERVKGGEGEEDDDPLLDSTFVSVVDGEKEDVFVEVIDDVVDVDTLVRAVADTLLLIPELFELLGVEDNTADFDDDLVTETLADTEAVTDGVAEFDTDAVFNSGDAVIDTVADALGEIVSIAVLVSVNVPNVEAEGLFVDFGLPEAELDTDELGESDDSRLKEAVPVVIDEEEDDKV